MIVRRGEIDVCLGDDVAQRHVGEAALGIEPLGGGEDGGPGLIARHGVRKPCAVAFQTFLRNYRFKAGMSIRVLRA